MQYSPSSVIINSSASDDKRYSTSLTTNEVKESVVVGALIGAISYIAFSIIYIPIVIILMKFFGLYTNYGVSLILSSASFWILVVLTVFMAVLSATVNAFSAFLTYYINDIIKGMNHNNTTDKNDNEQFKL